jgi:hypothetical protein
VGTRHQDVIEINGKKYNAVTGQLIKDQTGVPATAHMVSAKPAPTTVQQNGVVLDGFKRPKKTAQRSAAPAHHKSVQKSQTLMRQAVHKPEVVSKPVAKSSHGPDIQKAKLGASPHLVRAASEIKMSSQVSKFGSSQHQSTVVKKVQPLPVKQHEPHQTSKSPIAPVSHTTNAPQHRRSTAASAHIERALAHATAHEQQQLPPIHAKRRKKVAHKLGISARTLAISSTVLAGVLLGGFFAVQNVPNLSMRVAAARAGFSAGMPGYNPSGFSFKGPIQYSPGQVTISFRSNTDDRAYSVTQKASNWNSDALLSNYVVASNRQYQTYQDRGRTLYIYDGSNATWVDNGVWYQIEGNSGMTTDQLVRVATSI